MASNFNLSHLKQLEAESIHILREVVAEFENPVMMYSIGKDSSVMVHLARKAFHPGTLPFKLLHVLLLQLYLQVFNSTLKLLP